MPRDEKRPGPRRKGPGRNDQYPAKDTDSRSGATLPGGIPPVTELADWRALRSWTAAVEHLNAAGLPAAVPVGIVKPLQRRGLVVWAAEPRRAA
jgi:hypothetical protein